MVGLLSALSVSRRVSQCLIEPVWNQNLLPCHGSDQPGMAASQCLIEPVWNQNFIQGSSCAAMHAMSQCLIEPVWNQNSLVCLSRRTFSLGVSMSNRTSMESKQSRHCQRGACCCFVSMSNRTSMESKRHFRYSILIPCFLQGSQCLIEPVWNQNLTLLGTALSPATTCLNV